ncbi:MAG: hypothetical protein ACXWWQ_05180 [Candidatus Limnocylindria bacterium]
MLNHDHPDDERLSALAAGDTEATDDATHRAHVTSCDRCADAVSELTVLRAALAELPDVAPHRPLRILPPVEADAPGAADRLGLWARRLFAPALTVGAALAMVGVVGTALPSLGGMAQSGAADSAPSERTAALDADASAVPEIAAPFATEDAANGGAGGQDATTLGVDDESVEEDLARESAEDAPFAERSPWPMVLFAGIALMIGAALLRWILVPRAG